MIVVVDSMSRRWIAGAEINEMTVPF